MLTKKQPILHPYDIKPASESEWEKARKANRAANILAPIVKILKHNCLKRDSRATICLTVRDESFSRNESSKPNGCQPSQSPIWYSELDLDLKSDMVSLNTQITELIYNTVPQTLAVSSKMTLELDLRWYGIICSRGKSSETHGDEMNWHSFKLGTAKIPKWFITSTKHVIMLSAMFGGPQLGELERNDEIQVPWCVYPKPRTVQEWVMELEDFEEESWRLTE
ncbi:hypothetical protein ACMFMG_001544 [Clarireedia jacksonii]